MSETLSTKMAQVHNKYLEMDFSIFVKYHHYEFQFSNFCGTVKCHANLIFVTFILLKFVHGYIYIYSLFGFIILYVKQR